MNIITTISENQSFFANFMLGFAGMGAIIGAIRKDAYEAIQFAAIAIWAGIITFAS